MTSIIAKSGQTSEIFRSNAYNVAMLVQFFCFWTIRFETLYATSYHQALNNLQSKPMVPRIWKFKTKTNFISYIFEGSQLVKARDIFDDDLDCQSGFLKLGGRVLKRSSNPAKFYFQRGCKTLGYVFIVRNVFNLQMNFQRHYSVLPTTFLRNKIGNTDVFCICSPWLIM